MNWTRFSNPFAGGKMTSENSRALFMYGFKHATAGLRAAPTGDTTEERNAYLAGYAEGEKARVAALAEAKSLFPETKR